MHSYFPRTLALGAVVALAACGEGGGGDQSAELMEAQAQIVELQAQVGQLEQQLNQAQSYRAQLSTAASTLEAAINDVDRRALDLAADNLQFTLPEVQGALFNAKQRMAELRTITDALVESLAPAQPEAG